MQGMRDDMNRGFKTVNNTMKAGFEKLDGSIWQSSDRMIQSNKQMQQSIQQQIAASQQKSSGGSRSSSRSIWGKVLGGVVGAVTTCLGGGPVVGSLVDNVVGSGGKAKAKDVIGEYRS
jgi:hypothetical protein